MTLSVTSFDQRQLRDVLGTFVTGVTVITTRDENGTAHGVTANSFSSVSIDPPLVLWSQSLTSKSYPAFRDTDYFAVNILADGQVGISNHFAKSRDDKFQGIRHTDGLGGAPVIDGVAASLECIKVATYPGGDHVVYLGRVECISQSSRRPLAFGAGKYMLAHSYDLESSFNAPGSVPQLPPAEIRTAIAALPEMAKAVGDHTLCLSVWGNCGPTAIMWEPSSDPVSENLLSGLVMPVTQSATGRVFAAFLPEQITKPFVDEDLRSLSQAGVNLSTRRQQFENEVAKIKKTGLARMIGFNPSRLHKTNVNTFSAPILDRHGNILMALSVAVCAKKVSPEWDGEVSTKLIAAANEIASRLKSA